MKRNMLARVAALSMCAALFLAGCGSDSKSEDKKTSTGKTAAASTEKEELHVAISANPPSLDPQSINSNIVGGIGIHVYESLFAMNENYEPMPVLAESYEVSDDGMVYTIKLRQGVKFHNGEEMTADDVVASMNRWLEVSAKANTLIGGSTFEKVDDYTVTLKANQASSDIIMILASPIQFAAIYPAEVVESATADGIDEYIGTGPYKVAEWKQDQYVKLEENADYAPAEGEASGLAGKKQAATKTLYFDVVTDTATRIAGVQNGQYDIAEEIPADNYEELSKDENLKMSVERYGNPDLYEVNASWSVPTDAQWGTDAGKEYYNQNDVEKAKELLKKAGYNNEKIVLVTTPDYAEMYNATLVVQEQLKNAGINAEVESYDFSTFMEHRADPKQFSMFITSNSYNMLPIQLSVLDKGWAGLNAQEVTDGIQKIRSAASDEEAAKAWQDLQTFLYEDGAATVIGHYTGISAMSNSVENVGYLRFPIYWNATASK